MCHAAGYAEVWYGSISGAKIELATDAVVRTALAEDYAAGRAPTATLPAIFMDLRQGCARLRSADAHVGPAAASLTEHARPVADRCLS